MKTLLPVKSHSVGLLLKMFSVSLVVWACSQDSDVAPVRPNSSTSSNEKFSISEPSADGRKSCVAEGPRYNLNVFLQGDERRAFGFIKFRQHEDETLMIHLDTWIHGLEPNTSYVLQRAVDTTIDGNCTGTAWLTLGEGLTPKSIVTDSRGSGFAALFRALPPTTAVGTVFDIHFQIVKEGTTTVALASDCYQYAVH